MDIRNPELETKKDIEKTFASEAKDEPTVSTEPAVLLSWEAPEYIKQSKGAIWFLVAGILATILIFYAVYTNSWTFAVAILIASGVYYLYHHVEPKKIQISFSETGIKIGEQNLMFSEIESFWIVYKPPHVKNLHLRTKKKVMRDFAIPLEGQDPIQVHSFLASRVYEQADKDETMSELLIRTLKL